MLSTGVRWARWDAEVVARREAAVSFPLYPLTRSDELRALCDEASTAARGADATYAVFELRTPAYACAGLHRGLRTVYPPYERRAWMLEGFLRSTAPEFLFVGELSACPAPLTCAPVSPHVTSVTMPPSMSPDLAMRALGIDVRPLPTG